MGYDLTMGNSKSVRSADLELVQIVDAALEDSVRRSGSWLACRPGCTQCCIGVFAISQLDALRLREGLAELERRDPGRAQRVRQRSQAAVRRLEADFPGDVSTGIIAEDSDEFEAFANDEPCPVLDLDMQGFRPAGALRGRAWRLRAMLSGRDPGADSRLRTPRRYGSVGDQTSRARGTRHREAWQHHRRLRAGALTGVILSQFVI